MNDLVRAWLFGAIVYVVINIALAFTVGTAAPALYLLAPLCAGITSSAYHAEFGTGGWPRHFAAVLLAPVVIAAYILVVRYVQTGEFGIVNAVGGIATTLVVAGAGIGIVMGGRMLAHRRAGGDE